MSGLDSRYMESIKNPTYDDTLIFFARSACWLDHGETGRDSEHLGVMIGRVIPEIGAEKEDRL